MKFLRDSSLQTCLIASSLNSVLPWWQKATPLKTDKITPAIIMRQIIVYSNYWAEKNIQFCVRMRFSFPTSAVPFLYEFMRFRSSSAISIRATTYFRCQRRNTFISASISSLERSFSVSTVSTSEEILQRELKEINHSTENACLCQMAFLKIYMSGI